MLNIRTMCHAWNLVLGSPAFDLLDRSRYMPTDIARMKMVFGYTARSVMKSNTSPAGGARIIIKVVSHFTRYGPAGVLKGFVDAQNFGYGRTPCLPHSRSMRDWPRSVATRFPKALSAMRKLRARTEACDPKTDVKRREATVCLLEMISFFGTDCP